MERIEDIQVLEATKRFQGVFESLKELFLEREELIEQIKLALICRAHLLIFGPTGTAKTEITNAVFAAINSAETFSIGFSKFMSEERLFGTLNPKKMREEGVLEHNITGSILTARLANLREFFDANEPLLRATLDVLNERRFERGTQKVEASLHTAIATTNSDQEEILDRNPDLGPVIDRFLFQAEVKPVAKKENRLKMYRTHLDGRRQINISLPFSDVQILAHFVQTNNIGIPSEVLEQYDRLLSRYAEKSGEYISDRRACEMLLVLKAFALLAGRKNVLVSDLPKIGLALLISGDKEKEEKFNEACKEVL